MTPTLLALAAQLGQSLTLHQALRLGTTFTNLLAGNTNSPASLITHTTYYTLTQTHKQQDYF
jgi:hypothetical protein